MSTEKLSELSKPVAYLVVRKAGVKGIGDPRQIVDGEKYNPLSDDYWCPGGREKHVVTDLYSQEYASALLARIAELEAKLATPVRLPGSFYPDGDIDLPLVIELDGTIEAIRAAGFIVDGDE